MDIALLAVLSAGGFVYLYRFLVTVPDRHPTTGPAAGGFSATDIWIAGFLMLLLISNTVENWGRKQVFTPYVIIASCVLYLVLIVFLVVMLAARRRNPIRLFGLEWTRWKKELPRIVLALMCVYPVIILIQLIMQKIYGPEAAQQEIVQFLANSPGWNERLLLIVLAVIVAPLAEETIFRGYFYGVIRQYWGRWPAILINSAVFALIHSHVPALPGLFVLAAFLSLIYERTGSLWANIILHAIFNLVTVIGILYFPSSLP